MLSWTVIFAASLVAGQTKEIPSNYEHLKCYDQLIGTWKCEGVWAEDSPGFAKKGDPFTAQLKYEWILSRNVVEGTWKVEFKEGPKLSGKVLIGWDPADKRIVYGGMDSAGGHAIAEVTYDAGEKTWREKRQMVLPDGTKTADTIVLALKKPEVLVWQNVDRPNGPDSPKYEFSRSKR